MDIGLFDYELPEKLIAQYPAPERDASRLLVVDRATGATEDRFFSDLPQYLRAGDVLVFNDSRVVKARLIGEKEGTGARIELFLVKRLSVGGASRGAEHEEWETLARPARRLHIGDRVFFGAEGGPFAPGDAARPPLAAEVTGKTDDGFVHVRFHCEGVFLEALERLGHIPLPPYIRRGDEASDAERYQTVYAAAPGSAAAPTAGLHFTENLLGRLRGKGVETVFVTLHVGLGTFRPVQTDAIEDHKMHTEPYRISEDARLRINRAKSDGRRVICVGTTSVRALESASVWDHEGGRYIPGCRAYGDTDIFIYPGGRKFFMADGLITNFHLPKSTLLMLVSAFAGREKTLEVYGEAIRKGYRFFSYGDAMLIL
ncbi:MAG: tRNA preQ1(34) S-adenosylmethionine ribosyltransferase-isomerase QueA [Clostridiales Family XIII bacterium]|jgi:S-adenosylmethionine:tRNA ribosyltransferase-isomerase|nr:tRNA preQ1(34) S-adenosylmethionine ribosyltransferase-isomerase QueA [Clostridiales Family XIII bacterium]